MPKPDYLRLVDPAAEDRSAEHDLDVLLREVCEAFTTATGWPLQLTSADDRAQNGDLTWSAPATPGVGTALRLVRHRSDASDRSSSVGWDQAAHLAKTVADLWQEIGTLRRALAEREGELATEVPVVARATSVSTIATRLEGILRAGAEGVGCDAAGIYLLDPATTSLKLRASWGLPQQRLLDAPRTLRGALADLEALLGHAVVLSDPTQFEYWKAPEPCGAAVCVPVSSTTTPLGTLWVFSRRTRDFTDSQTNMLEVVAGRLAAELEREVFVADAAKNRIDRRELERVGLWQSESLPSVQPLIEGWRVAGRLRQVGRIASAFFDWFTADQSACAVTLGAASEPGLPGALVATQLRTVLRSQALLLDRCDVALQRAGIVLSSLSAGSSPTSAFMGLLGPNGHLLRVAAAGNVAGLIVEKERCRPSPFSIHQGLGDVNAPPPSESLIRLKQGAQWLTISAASNFVWDNDALANLADVVSKQLGSAKQRTCESLADIAVEAVASLPSVEMAAADIALVVIQRC